MTFRICASGAVVSIIVLTGDPAMAAVGSPPVDLHPVTLSILAAALLGSVAALVAVARRARLAAAGNAPPGGRSANGAGLVSRFVQQNVRGAARTPDAAGVTPAAEPVPEDAGFDALPVALLELDLDGAVVRVNGAAADILGAAPVRGRAFADLVEPLGTPVTAMIAEALGEGSRRRHEMVRLRDHDGDLYLRVGLTRVRVTGGDRLIVVLSDASEIRQLEDQFAQSQKMEAVGQLAGGVAHDFNNLLTAISGHCDLLLLGKDISHPDYSDLIQVRQNATRAAALVRQLLAFSRKQTLTPAVLSVRDVISDTHYMLDRIIGERVQIRLQHGREIGAVRADQQQLEQALMNLVVNARDAMPEGGTITISTENRRFPQDTTVGQAMVPAGDYVEIAVDDQGPGIPEVILDRVFDPFFTTKPLGQGTGLGLSTVYGIVNQSGGYVTAGNNEDGGARFRVFLPRIEMSDVVQPIAPVVEARDQTGAGSVLLVEDEAPVRSFAARALSIRGYEVTACESAAVAMERLKDPALRVDLIISDVMMPGMDGPTFAGEARRLRPGLPVILISGYAEASFRNQLSSNDFVFLSKPFSLSELTAKVKEVLS